MFLHRLRPILFPFVVALLTLAATRAEARELMHGGDCAQVAASTDGGAAANLLVRNLTGRQVALYWVDYQGSPQFFAWIQANADYPGTTSYVGHRWLLADERGNCLGRYYQVADGEIAYFGSPTDNRYGVVCSVSDGTDWAVRYSEINNVDWVCNAAREALRSTGRPIVSTVSSFFAISMNNKVTSECRFTADGTLSRRTFDKHGWQSLQEALDWIGNSGIGLEGCRLRVEENLADPSFPVNAGTHTSFCSVRGNAGGWAQFHGATGAWKNCLDTEAYVAPADVAVMNAGYLPLDDAHTGVIECRTGQRYQRTGDLATLFGDLWGDLENGGGTDCISRYRSAADEECTADQRAVRQENGHLLCMPSWTPTEIFDNGAVAVDQALQEFWEKFQEQIGDVDPGVEIEELEIERVGDDKVKATQPLTPAEQNKLDRQTRDRDDGREYPTSGNRPKSRVQWSWPIGADWYGAQLDTVAEWDVSGVGSSWGRLWGYVGPFAQSIVEVNAYGDCLGTDLDFLVQARILGQTVYQSPESARRIRLEWRGEAKTWKKTFLKHKERFMVGPVPMSVTLGVVGEAGYGAPTAYARDCADPVRSIIRADLPAKYVLTGYAQGGADIEVAQAGIRGNLHFIDGQAFAYAAAAGHTFKPCVGAGLRELRSMNGDLRLFAEVAGPLRKVVDWFNSWYEVIRYEYESVLFKWGGIGPNNDSWYFGGCGA